MSRIINGCAVNYIFVTLAIERVRVLCGYPLKTCGYDGVGILSTVIVFNKNQYPRSNWRLSIIVCAQITIESLRA